jgi:hypothetical protein
MIRKLAVESASRGQKQACHDAFQLIQNRLSTHPGRFGERRYSLLKGELPCHIGAIRPVAVHFAIHEERRVVFVLKEFLLG